MNESHNSIPHRGYTQNVHKKPNICCLKCPPCRGTYQTGGIAKCDSWSVQNLCPISGFRNNRWRSIALSVKQGLWAYLADKIQNRIILTTVLMKIPNDKFEQNQSSNSQKWTRDLSVVCSYLQFVQMTWNKILSFQEEKYSSTHS